MTASHAPCRPHFTQTQSRLTTLGLQVLCHLTDEETETVQVGESQPIQIPPPAQRGMYPHIPPLRLALQLC